jgi:hypothetical protein
MTVMYGVEVQSRGVPVRDAPVSLVNRLQQGNDIRADPG